MVYQGAPIAGRTGERANQTGSDGNCSRRGIDHGPATHARALQRAVQQLLSRTLAYPPLRRCRRNPAAMPGSTLNTSVDNHRPTPSSGSRCTPTSSYVGLSFSDSICCSNHVGCSSRKLRPRPRAAGSYTGRTSKQGDGTRSHRESHTPGSEPVAHRHIASLPGCHATLIRPCQLRPEDIHGRHLAGTSISASPRRLQRLPSCPFFTHKCSFCLAMVQPGTCIASPR